MGEFNSKKAIHYSLLALIVIFTAAISAFMLHGVLIRMYIVVPSRDQLRKQNQNVTNNKETTFPVDANGTYILPTVNPTFPLQPGYGSVGGITACARLYNLRSCLSDKKSSLVSQITIPIASSGAGLETICGSILNDLAPLRSQTVEIGCIW